jgi:predicted permease
MDTLFQDVRFALRMLARKPGFTAVAVITLALGIGVNTVLFSVVNGVLLNPLRYGEPDRLVALYSRNGSFTKSSISYPNFLDWTRDNHSFTAIAGYRGDDYSLTGLGEPERVPVEMVSAPFFSVLGVQPVIGHDFTPEEDQLGAGPVALISGGLWKRKFGASPDVLGKSMTLNGKAYTILGVIPADFHYQGNNYHRSDVFVPIGQWSEPIFRDRRVGMGMNAVGKLKPGVTFEQARADMDALGRDLAAAYPDADKKSGITLVPLKQNVVGDVQPYLLVLTAAVGFVLLIACVNVANLLLARSTERTTEFAIRTALGARRSRVVRQLLTESTLLALAGGGLGILTAAWGVGAALRALPAALPRADEIHLDGHVLLFTLITSVLAGILFGLAPALGTSRAALHETLKQEGRGGSGARHRTQRVFVTVEVAMALVLLTGAGLMLRSLLRLWGVDPGFDTHNVLKFSTSFPPITDPAALRVHWRRMQESLEAVPGVLDASMTVGATPGEGDSELPFWFDGQPKPATQAEMKVSLFYLVQPDYLKVMRTPLLRGRFLAPQDDEHTPMVMVIDERFRQLYFGDQDPIGRRINFDILNMTAEVVGVVGHVKQWGLGERPNTLIQAQCYFNLVQLPDRLLPLLATGANLVVRTAGPPLGSVNAIRGALKQLDSQQVMYGIETMDQVMARSLAARRFSMVLLGAFAALALIMSCVGVYAVISFLAASRTHEIGVRMALGAAPGQVLKMILGEAAGMALLGVLVGIAAALALTRLMASLLFGVSARDPLTFAAMAGLLVLVALAACYLPARRAAKVDPMVALRHE